MSLMLGANIWAGARGGGMATAPSAWEALLDSLQSETDGAIWYFTDPDYPRELIRDTTTPANSVDRDANTGLTYTSPSLKNVTGADGLLKYAGHNLCLQSNTIGTAGWSASNSTVTNAAGTAPGDYGAVCSLYETVANANHSVAYGSVFTPISGGTYRVNIVAKASGRDYVDINLSGPFTTGNIVRFTLTGSGTATNRQGSPASSNRTCTLISDGYYLCGFDFTPNAASALTATLTTAQDDAGSSLYTGTAGIGVLVGAVHIYATPAETTFVPTTTAAKYRLPIDHDANGDPLGLLVEEARTNLALYSSDFTNAAWTKSNMTTAQTATGPGGTTNGATTLTATAGNATALQAITSASAARITSTYIKRRTGTGNIDLTQDNGSTWTTVTVTSSWTRVNIASVTSTNPTVGIRIVTSGDAVDVAHFQHEVGAFITSPIRTTSATVTRAADNISKATSGLPYSATAGTMVASFRPYTLSGNRSIWQLVGADTNERYLMRCDTSNPTFFVIDGGSLVANIDAGTAVASTNHKSGAAWAADDFAHSFDAGTVGTDATGTLPTVTNLYLGSVAGTGEFSGSHIKYIKYLPRRVANADLQTETAA